MSTLGISIEARAPRLMGAGYIDIFTDQVASYDHTIEAFGGYKTANFTLTGPQAMLEDWFENGLMREIVTYDEAQQVIWEGFVNSVALTVGGRSVERGPVLDVINRLRMVYSTIDTSVSPPIVGGRVRTGFMDETASQALFGILSDIYSVSGVSAANANYIRDTFLAEHALPESTDRLSLEPGQISATIHCAGYFEIEGRHIYNSVLTGNTDLSTKLTAVLNDEPNGWLVVDAKNITANTLQVPQFDDSDRRGLEIIKGLVAMGDAGANRYLFGVYTGRQAVYQAAPTAYAYEYRVSENDLRAYQGAPVQPWSIMPGRWIFYPDFLIVQSAVALRNDPRSVFIESVNFTAPWGISLNGGKVRKLPQILARLGLGGTA